MVTVRPLDSLGPADLAIAGGKALGCARLRQAGFKVPNGFVVLTSKTVDFESLQLSESLQAFPSGTLFAVRSSGVGEDGEGASFAGIHRTLLNVPAAGVPEAVLQCMASGRSALADSYRTTQGLSEAPEAISVLVQQMVPAEVAGVAFTVDPLGSPDRLIINAAWGLGDAVAGGQTDPDSFTVERTTKAIVQRRLGDKRHCVAVADGLPTLRETPVTDQERACLTDSQVAALAELLLQVEHSLGAPQDVEWCLVDGEFWLVQSRPITSDARYGTSAWSLCHPDIEWSRATALESLPELPKPQVSAAHCDLMERGVRGIAPELIAPVDELGPVVRLVLGRLYLNISQFKHMAHAVGRPAHPVTTAHGGASETGDADAPQLTPGAALRLVPRLLRLAGVWPPFQKPAWADLPGTRQRLDRLLHQDPSELSDAAVFAEVAAPKDVARALGTGVLDASALLLAVVRSLAPGATPALERLRYAAQAANKTQSSQEGLQLLTLAEVARQEPVTKAFLTQPTRC